jgi:hypothetical protein
MIDALWLDVCIWFANPIGMTAIVLGHIFEKLN